jgi:rod shape-determining protein MreC
MAQNFRKDNPALRSQAIVIVLLAVSLICMIAYAREGENGPMHALQAGTSVASAPLQAASGAIAAVEYRAFTAVDDAQADANTLSELRQQNEELRQTVAQMEEYRQEAERLQQLLDFQDMYSLEGVTCTVLSRSTDSWNNVVTIGKGSAEGVRAGLPVAGPTGLVGQVVSVTPHSAKVRLLQDPQSGVAVMIQSSREEGILKGSFDGLLYLENVSDDAKVEQGDVIVTSGLGGSFYRGIIVGTVVKVEGEAGLASRRIVVEPNEAVGLLQEVMVITAMNSEGAAAQQKTDAGASEPSGADGAGAEAAGADGDAAAVETTDADAAYYQDAAVYDAPAYDDTTYYDDGTTYDDGTASYDGTVYDDGSYTG